MADAQLVFPPGFRVTDANDEPIAGAKVKVYSAGTSTPATVYSDAGLLTSLGSVVTCDDSGYPTSDGATKTLVYTGTDSYKLVITDADDVTIVTHDNIKGAVAIPGETVSAYPVTPVLSRTTTTTILADYESYRGRLINANPTGGSFAITLPSAVTVQDGYRLGVRHNGSANTVTLRAIGGQTISGAGQATLTSFSLTALGHTVWMVSDGAGWSIDTEAPPFFSHGVPIVQITDRLVAAPSGATGGARYIVNGTPSGVWSTLGFAEHQIVEADGNGSWFAYTPPEGTLAYVVDENLYTAYIDAAWSDQSGMGAPSTSFLKILIAQDQKSSGTDGGSKTTGTWSTATLNTLTANTIDGASLDTNVITLPAGTYRIDAHRCISGGNTSEAIYGKMRVYNVTASTEIAISMTTGHLNPSGAPTSGMVSAQAYVTFAVESEIRMDVYGTATGGAVGLGEAGGGTTEVYGSITVLDMSSLQGATGAQGPQGPDGLDAAYSYQWSALTSGDPGTGKLHFDNGTIASATALLISQTDANGSDLAATIASWDNSTSTIKARLKITKEGEPQNFVEFNITGTATDAGAYWSIPVSYVNDDGAFSSLDDLAVLVLPVGDKGDAGADGAGLSYLFSTSTTTGSDPGTGGLRFNNATPASVTEVALSDLSNATGNPDVSALLLALDDSTSTAHRGYLHVVKIGAEGTFATFDLTGASTDESGWVRFAVTLVDNAGSFSNLDQVRVFWTRTGDKGVTGDTGATGPTGPNVGLDYQFSTGTSGDPGAGKVLIDNATPASATNIHISETDRNSSSHADMIATWNDSTNTAHYGTLRIIDVSNRANWLEYAVTGALTDAGGYDTIPVTYVDHGGTIANDTIVSVVFSRTGDKGADGTGSLIAARWIYTATGGETSVSGVDDDGDVLNYAVGEEQVYLNGVRLVSGEDYTASDGSSITGLDLIVGDTLEVFGYIGQPNVLDGSFRWNFDGGSTSMADPSSGNFRFNNATVASATAIAISYTSAAAHDLETLIAMWDDSTSTVKGQLVFKRSADSAVVAVFNITGVTDNSSWAQLAVTYVVDSGVFVDEDQFAVAFVRTGDKGETGSSDSSIGLHTIWIPAAAMISRTTNGAALGLIETTTNKIMFPTLDFDTSTQEYAQFAIRMPKSWNESTVTAAFTWSHPSTTTNFGVVWNLAGVALSNDDAGDAAFGTAQTATDTGGTTNDIYISPTTSAITIAGTPAAEDWVVFQVSRVVADGSDTMAVDARLHGVSLYFTIDATTDA